MIIYQKTKDMLEESLDIAERLYTERLRRDGIEKCRDIRIKAITHYIEKLSKGNFKK